MLEVEFVLVALAISTDENLVGRVELILVCGDYALGSVNNSSTVSQDSAMLLREQAEGFEKLRHEEDASNMMNEETISVLRI